MTSEFGDTKLHILTQSFAARAAFYEHLFHFESSILVERSFAALNGKDVLVILCNNSFGIATHAAVEVLEYLFTPPSPPPPISSLLTTFFLGFG